MKPSLFSQLVTADDPLNVLFRNLVDGIWTRDSFQAASAAGRLEGDYLSSNEHLTSSLELTLYQTFFEVYGLLAGMDPRKERVAGVLESSRFTLLVFDGLSLREIPAVLEVLDERRLKAEVTFGLSAVPSSTEDFFPHLFPARHPKDLVNKARQLAFDYHFIQKPEQWSQGVGLRGERHVVWVRVPDNIFGLNDHGGVSYTSHIIQPVQRVLRDVLASDPPLPLIVTSDHGYIWQGGGAYWTLSDDEMRLMAQHFQQGRSTKNAPHELGERRHVWQSGNVAAAIGRFAWGRYVRGGSKLYKHEGVSLMECITPWIEVTML
jgi:hypothetical protein